MARTNSRPSAAQAPWWSAHDPIRPFAEADVVGFVESPSCSRRRSAAPPAVDAWRRAPRQAGKGTRLSLERVRSHASRVRRGEDRGFGVRDGAQPPAPGVYRGLTTVVAARAPRGSRPHPPGTSTTSGPVPSGRGAEKLDKAVQAAPPVKMVVAVDPPRSPGKWATLHVSSGLPPFSPFALRQLKPVRDRDAAPLPGWVT